MDDVEDSGLLFRVTTPLGFEVRTSPSYWKLITEIKHPVMRGRQAVVYKALEEPEEIRQSRTDPAIYLFYRAEREGRWTCAVAKRLDTEGFLVTAYPTDAIKEGTRVWPR